MQLDKTVLHADCHSSLTTHFFLTTQSNNITQQYPIDPIYSTLHKRQAYNIVPRSPSWLAGLHRSLFRHSVVGGLQAPPVLLLQRRPCHIGAVSECLERVLNLWMRYLRSLLSLRHSDVLLLGRTARGLRGATSGKSLQCLAAINKKTQNQLIWSIVSNLTDVSEVFPCWAEDEG